MRRILTTGLLLAALTGAGLTLASCEDGDSIGNPFPEDAAVDAALPGDGNPFLGPDAALTDADTTD
jgi:hypothetical protein